MSYDQLTITPLVVRASEEFVEAIANGANVHALIGSDSLSNGSPATSALSKGPRCRHGEFDACGAGKPSAHRA
eukprot:SAG11_NODE_1031_length_6111_cov_2.587159_7_plen_73_part_00